MSEKACEGCRIQLAKTTAMITGQEQALMDHPEEQESLLQSISSLTKMRRQLEADLALATSSPRKEMKR